MEKLQAIVLRCVKYNDRRIIADLYTDTHGRMACVMPLKCRLMPFHVISLELDYHSNRELQTVKSLTMISHVCVLQEIRFNPVKSVIAMFLAEFLCNVLREETANHGLFDYVATSVQLLDRQERGVANFHLTFMLRLTRLMGIYPNLDGQADGLCFDMADGCYSAVIPSHPHFLMPDEARVLPWLLHMDFCNMHLFRFSRLQRNRCLDVLTEYYRLHLSNFGTLKSQGVLYEVFC